MDPLISKVMGYLESELAVIKRAPLALFLIAVIVGGLVWYGASSYYSSQYQGTIRNLEAARTAAEKQRDLAKDELERERESKKGDAQVATSLPQPNTKQKDTNNIPAKLPPAAPPIISNDLHQQEQPYSIQKKDRREFITTLSSVGSYYIDMSYISEDPKARLFAEELAELFQLSGWRVGPMGISYGPPGEVQLGVVINIKEEKYNAPSGATLLLGLLTNQNIDTRIQQMGYGQPPSFTFQISIGRKPKQ